MQTDWSGGSGQTNWSDTTKFDSSSNVTTSTVGQATITSTEKFSNTGFETDLTGWDRGAYNLYDQFTTDRAAGSVNGTSAEPTGGTRTVLDSNNVLSISGGLLTFATGGAAAGNPGIAYSSLTRSAGLSLIGSITPTGSSSICFGFDNYISGNVGANCLQFQGGDFLAFESFASQPKAQEGWTASTTYSTAVVLRSTGAYYFIKGGAYSDWTMIWISSINNSDPVYPVSIIRVNPSSYTADNLRVPYYLWLPTPLAYDTFATDSSNATETVGPDSQTTASLNWTNSIGTWQSNGGSSNATALSGGIAARTVNTSSANAIADVALTRSAGNGGIVFRYQDTSNYLIAYHDGTNAKVDKVVGGVTTNVISGAKTYSAGSILRVMASGTGVKLYYNNSLINSATVTDLSTATIHGLYTTDTGNSFDNFTLWSKTGHTVPDTDLTATRDTGTKYAGVASAKFVAPSGNDANFTQSVNVGDTSTYTLSAYAYLDETTAVSSNALSLYSNTSTISTTYTHISGGTGGVGGWYQLTGTVTGVDSSKPYGVQVKAGQTVYVDNISLSNYSSSGTLTSSIFDSGYSTNWGTMSWTATTPSNTSLTMKVRTSSSPTMSGATDFSSCDSITLGADISSNNCVSEGNRYIQYYATLANTDSLSTPTLQDVTISFAAASITIEASSPSGYTKDNTRPTLIFKKATNASSFVSSYSVSLDSGKNRSFSTSGIPLSGNGSSYYIWKDDSSVKVEFYNENDSDTSDDEIHVYFKDLDKQDLSEGKHAWTATAYDNGSNPTSQSLDINIDKSSPSFSELAIANVSTVNSGKKYNLDITNRMPSFSGLATDSYQGSTVTNSNGTKDTFDKVSSGPKTITLKYKKLLEGQSPISVNATYSDYLSKNFSLTDIQDKSDDKKSTRFYITTPYPLVDGYYIVLLSIKDDAGNTYNEPEFYISLNSSVTNPIQNIFTNSLETKITKQETVPAETEEEKQEIKENGYSVNIKVVDTENKPVAGAKVTIHSKIGVIAKKYC